MPQPLPASGRRRFGRILELGAVVAVVLLVLFHVAGGWYFSGQIYSGALEVAPDSVGGELVVEHVGPGSITLHDPAIQDAALHTSLVYGLAWDGGYGQISGAPTDTGSEVTRAFTVLTGSPPRPG